jgi:hypothetical protein
MAVFILKNTWGLDAGALQSKFLATVGSFSTGAYQADNKIDTVYVDPAIGLTLAQVQAIVQKHGNGVTTCSLNGVPVVWFVVPEAAYAAVLALVATIKALA